jgi:hypothetical protein
MDRDASHAQPGRFVSPAEIRDSLIPRTQANAIYYDLHSRKIVASYLTSGAERRLTGCWVARIEVKRPCILGYEKQRKNERELLPSIIRVEMHRFRQKFC